LVKKAIDEHAEYDTEELDRSRPAKKGQKRRSDREVTWRTGSSQHAHDGYKLCLKGKRRAADSRGTDWRGGGQMVEFEVQVNGHEATKKANRIQTARSFRLAARRQIRPGWTCPTLTGFLVE